MGRQQTASPTSEPASRSDEELSSLSSQSTPDTSPFRVDNRTFLADDHDASNNPKISSRNTSDSAQKSPMAGTQADSLISTSSVKEVGIDGNETLELGQSVQKPPQADSQIERDPSTKSQVQADEVSHSSRAARKSPNLEASDHPKLNNISPESHVSSSGVKRKRDAGSIVMHSFDPPYSAATAEEKASWGGFCEIESNPGVFNHLLQEFGVNGVKIQEIYDINEDYLLTLPQPVHGLIFLFQYTPDLDAGEQEEDECPSHVWFANQVAPNSCASVALVNMVNNIPDIDIGEKMKRFRYFTQPFSPAFRGDQIANCHFIRQAHNQYARKIDMLNSDAVLEDEWTQGQKKSKSNRSNKQARQNKKKKSVQEVGANHFVAYMPINGEAWRLDGLNNYPQKMGPCDLENWLATVTPWIAARMSTSEENGLQFSLLALVRDPISKRKSDLISNIKFVAAIEQKLQSMEPDWKAYEEINENTLASAALELGISEDDIFMTLLDEKSSGRLAKFNELDLLLELYRRVTTDQTPIRAELRDLVQTQREDELRAIDRQNDYVPLIQMWFRMLAENNELRGLVEGG